MKRDRNIRNIHLGSTIDEMTEQIVRQDPRFAEALLAQAVEAVVGNEPRLAMAHFRHVIRGSIGFLALARQTGVSERDLIRMFGPKGSPTLSKLLAVLAALQAHTGVRLEVTAVRLPPKRRKAAARSQGRADKAPVRVVRAA